MIVDLKKENLLNKLYIIKSNLLQFTCDEEI